MYAYILHNHLLHVYKVTYDIKRSFIIPRLFVLCTLVILYSCLQYTKSVSLADRHCTLLVSVTYTYLANKADSETSVTFGRNGDNSRGEHGTST